MLRVRQRASPVQFGVCKQSEQVCKIGQAVRHGKDKISGIGNGFDNAKTVTPFKEWSKLENTKNALVLQMMSLDDGCVNSH